jgi:hypothetical protein
MHFRMPGARGQEGHGFDDFRLNGLRSRRLGDRALRMASDHADDSGVQLRILNWSVRSQPTRRAMSLVGKGCFRSGIPRRVA